MTRALERHAAQQSSRLTMRDSLFDRVPLVEHRALEPMPIGEVGESTWDEIDAAQGGDEPLWRLLA
jgi:hypothetical protein